MSNRFGPSLAYAMSKVLRVFNARNDLTPGT
jgi:hypothetical protein